MLHTRRMGAMRCALMGGARAKDLVNRAWFGFYMRWAVGEGPGACCCATVCCVSASLSIASDRDMKRTMARMPPEMAAMMGGQMPINLGQFMMP